MDEKASVNRFWSVIEQGRKEGESGQEVARRLTGTLSSMDGESVLHWGLIYDEYHALAYKGKLWGAANIMDDGFCSDDGFHYFRAWLIARGREVYMAALKDPDSLAALPRQQDVRFESVNYAAMDAYEKMTGKDYYQASNSLYLSPEMKQEILSGITFAPDMDNDIYINGHYPRVFPNLTSLYEIGGQDVDIDGGKGDAECSNASFSEQLALAKQEVARVKPKKAKGKTKADPEL